MIKYTFVSHDDENQCVTQKEFVTESDAWSGIDGPVYNFFDFLRGCGFVFDLNSQLGVLTEKGKFISAADGPEVVKFSPLDGLDD